MNLITVFVVRSGAKRGRPDMEAAFPDAAQALSFAEDLHGLTGEECRRLRRERRIDLDRNRHGSDRCWIETERMAPDLALRALSGDLYLSQIPSQCVPLLSTPSRRSSGRTSSRPAARSSAQG